MLRGWIDTYPGSYPTCYSRDIINNLLGFVADGSRRDLLFKKYVISYIICQCLSWVWDEYLSCGLAVYGLK